MARFPAGPGQIASFRGMVPGRNMARLPAFFRATAERYGPVASLRLGRQRYYLVQEPALIEELLVTRARSFVKGRGVQRLERLLGRGLLTSNGEFHLRQRRLVQPAFHRERIAAYARAMVERAGVFANSLSADATLDIDAAMYRLTLGIAAATLFGADVDSAADRIGAALNSAMATFPASVSPAGELLDHFPMLPVVRRFTAARAQLDAIVYGLIGDRQRELEAGRGAERADVLSMLLASRENGAGMSPEQVRDEAMTIFLAGHETTANALTWTWYLLARNPDAEARLRAELDVVLDGRAPCADDVPALRFTRDVIAEAMRLYPPAWVIGRRAIETVALGEWTVPRGAVVLTSQAVVHRDPRFWREPDAFRPERWSNGEGDALPKFAYFPFGGGNRVCIGEGFAWTETVLVLATIARSWRFVPAPGLGEVAAAPLVTLRPARAVPLVSVR